MTKGKVIGKAICIYPDYLPYTVKYGMEYDVVMIYNNDYDPLLNLEYSVAHYRVNIPFVNSSKFRLDFNLKAAMLLHGIEPDDEF